MKTIIAAQCLDQTLTLTNSPKLASGGENVFQIELNFDSYWTGYGKEAVFWRDASRVFHVVMYDDTCIIPWELTAEPGRVHFSVRGVKGSVTRSSEEVILSFVQGPPLENNFPEPLPDVYTQLLGKQGVMSAQLNNLVAAGTPEDSELLDVRVGYDGTTYATAGEAVRDQHTRGVLVNAENYTTVLPSLDGAVNPRYIINFSTTATDFPASLPFTAIPSTLMLLETYTTPNGYKMQRLQERGNVYMREYGAGWSEWVRSNTPDTRINASNYKTILPDVDEAENKQYILNFSASDTNLPANLPFTTVPDSLLTLTSVINGGYKWQEISAATKGVLYRRTYAAGWREWFVVDNDSAAVTVNSGGSILAGVKECYDKGYKKVIVEAGEYDIISEYQAVYGSDYFTDYTDYSGTDKFARGIWLENIELVFSPGAKVTCHYTGDNANVEAYFSAFATGNNVVIDGLVLDATNLRYGIHPDFNTGEEATFFKVLNCDLKHVNGSNEQAIGAGFGIHVDWLIENTIFRSETNAVVFRVHNNVSDAAKSRLVVRNCYIDGPGVMRFNCYSTSPEISTVIVTGCSYVNEPYVSYETGESKTENIKLYAWNNTVRTE